MNRIRRSVIAGAFAAAAVAAPLAALALQDAPTADSTAAPVCLAWFGNKDDGNCLSYSNGTPVGVSTPGVALNGNGGWGISTGPLMPGTTISQGIG